MTYKNIIRACDSDLIADFFIECCILDLSVTPNIISTDSAETLKFMLPNMLNATEYGENFVRARRPTSNIFRREEHRAEVVTSSRRKGNQRPGLVYM